MICLRVNIDIKSYNGRIKTFLILIDTHIRTYARSLCHITKLEFPLARTTCFFFFVHYTLESLLEFLIFYHFDIRSRTVINLLIKQ